MLVHIALLRAVNVGGRNQIAMSDLCSLFASLGLSDVRSLLQSGNLVFKSEGRTGTQLESLLEAETEKRFKPPSATRRPSAPSDGSRPFGGIRYFSNAPIR